MKKKRQALVTFLIPAYNAQKYISSCLEGIYMQTLKNFKVLIIDDASTDGTGEILRKIKDKRFLIIKRKKNKGYISCLNLGLGLIKTKYTARLDADDIPAPSRLEKQLSFLEANQKVSVVGSRMAYIFGDSKVLEINIFGKKITPSFCPKMENSPFWSPETDGETIPHSSATFHTKRIKRAGCYRKLYPAEDMDLWYRLAAKGEQLACLPEILTLHRINPQGATSSALYLQAKVTEFVKESMRCHISKKAVPSFDEFSRHFSLSLDAKKSLKLKSDLRKAMGYFLNNQYLISIIIFLQITIRHPIRLAKKVISRFYSDPANATP